jgi:hypothetical protein
MKTKTPAKKATKTASAKPSMMYGGSKKTSKTTMMKKGGSMKKAC